MRGCSLEALEIGVLKVQGGDNIPRVVSTPGNDALNVSVGAGHGGKRAQQGNGGEYRHVDLGYNERVTGTVDAISVDEEN